MSCSLAEDTDDETRWWQAYQLAERDETAELHRRALSGDGHASLRLAAWLSDRGRTAEAIEIIRPLADAGDDVADLWLARWLAERDLTGELRQRAVGGSYHSLTELAGWLFGHGNLAELRDLLAGHQQDLAGWLGRQHDMRLIQVAADLGDEDAQARLDSWLTRTRTRPKP